MTLLETVRPRYGVGSLADVLPGALALLGVPGAADALGLAARAGPVRRVAVLLVDGLGSRTLPLAAPHSPVLADALAGRLGTLTELTSGFPSTTPTSLASIGTGAGPGEHGLIGFTVNVPGTTRVLNHINWWGDPDPLAWQPVTTQFERAAAAGVAVTVVNRPEFAGSGLSVSAYRGATHADAPDLPALAHEMLAALAAADGPALVYGYHPNVDRDGHLYGVDSPEWHAAVAGLDTLLDRLVAGLPPDAVLLVTADHGQLNIPPGSRFDLAADPRLRSGVRVVAGEPRVRYLHVEPGAAGDVIATWRAVLGGAAWVASREEAVAAGWFGPVREEHLSRVGDVVVACHDRYAVLSTGTEPEVISRLVAYHGSYTAAEMLVPLWSVPGNVGGGG
ncbi:alkaline phosphatase family protein [Rhizomonospora bruguierae]|uniref:alkaline phosphatase family protein n=1 Tax=Rhizomonospora bruguierae TaxID=1581705 RepID=UPI001BCB32F0|nr:alkaline phosphatase family protein [Micromonospora sp. NBRC 107566]